MIGSKVTAILLEAWILPIRGVASGRVCAYSLLKHEGGSISKKFKPNKIKET